MSGDKDVNLLPKNLRSREQAEWQKPITKSPEVKYSQPSMLEERLKEAEHVEPGLWGKIKSWFNQVPAPVKATKLEDLTLPPVKKEKEELRQQPIKVSWKEKFFGPPKVRLEAKPKPVDNKVELAESPVVPSVPTPALSDIPTPPPNVPVGVVLDVNLLPFTSRPTKTPLYLKKLGLVAVISLVFVGILYGALMTMIMYKKVEVKKVQDEAMVLAGVIDNAKKDLQEIGLVSKQMSTIRELAAQRTQWLKLLDKLEQLTLPNVSYSAISVTTEGVVVLPTQALTVSDIAKQMQVFQGASEVFNDVIISSVSVGSGEGNSQILVNTNFQLKVKPDWLKSK